MYEALLPVIYGFLYIRVAGNKELAEDLTAEAFVAAASEYGAGRAEVVTAPWLRTVAKRRLVDHWRRERTVRERTPSLGDRHEFVEDAGIGERQVVVRALLKLSDDERTALVMQHIDGYSVREVAEVIGRTNKATESLLGRARLAFRTAYSEVEHD